MSDLIERQAAIDEIDEWIKAFRENGHKESAADTRLIRDGIIQLPSVPRKGKWIDYSDEGFVECPFCHSATNCDGNKDELHYCFSCGAELRPQFEEPEINPSRGCEDYDGEGGCKTKDGCADRRGESE